MFDVMGVRLNANSIPKYERERERERERESSKNTPGNAEFFLFMCILEEKDIWKFDVLNSTKMCPYDHICKRLN